MRGTISLGLQCQSSWSTTPSVAPASLRQWCPWLGLGSIHGASWALGLSCACAISFPLMDHLIQLSSRSNCPLRQSHRHIYQAQLPPLMFPRHLVSFPRFPVPQLTMTFLLPSRPGVMLPHSRHSYMRFCIVHELRVAWFRWLK